MNVNGSLIYLVYGDVVILNNHNSKSFNEFKETIYPYWSQPGRKILSNLLKDLEFPNWCKNNQRLYFDNEQNDYLLSQNTNINSFIEYIKTWSALNKYFEHDNVNKNIVEDLRKGLELELKNQNELNIAWPVGMFMFKRKE